jgi:hypothetical protein
VLFLENIYALNFLKEILSSGIVDCDRKTLNAQFFKTMKQKWCRHRGDVVGMVSYLPVEPRGYAGYVPHPDLSSLDRAEELQNNVEGA